MKMYVKEFVEGGLFAANALCALYEFLPNPNLRFAALKCLSSVVGAQQPTGMWKDMLTTGQAALALNNARHLGLRVAHDEEWMDKIPFETIASDGPDGAVLSRQCLDLEHALTMSKMTFND